MTLITFENKSYQVNENESVLDCLLRNGEAITNSCRNGICQSCLMKSASTISTASQKGLSEAKKRSGLFLSCQEFPTSDIEILKANSSIMSFDATITSQKIISDSVVIIKVMPEDNFDYKAGQFVNLLRADGLCRSYSIANKTGDKELEFHIRKVPNGQMSSWLYDEKLSGEKIKISDPLGECYLTDFMHEKDLLLIGVGTGLAPLYGIALDCVQSNRERKVNLFHGGLSFNSLYYIEKLQEIECNNDFFTYQPVYLEGDVKEGFIQGDLIKIIKDFDYDKNNTIVIICGDSQLTKKLKQEIFLSGVPSINILSDEFVSPKHNDKT